MFIGICYLLLKWFRIQKEGWETGLSKPKQFLVDSGVMMAGLMLIHRDLFGPGLFVCEAEERKKIGSGCLKVEESSPMVQPS